MEKLVETIHACTRCKRLRKYCEEVAKKKRRAFQGQHYWGKPVAGFGNIRAGLMIVGLAPAAHGGNRTGRIFTGDRSGDFLFRALFKAGFSNQAQSVSKNDGLRLRNAYICSIIRCAPPANMPLPQEIENCLPYLRQEIAELSRIKVFVALGRLAFITLWPEISGTKRPLPTFKHGGEILLPDGRLLLMSYHPSQQNTFTGKLTEPMFDAVFSRAKGFISEPN